MYTVNLCNSIGPHPFSEKNLICFPLFSVNVYIIINIWYFPNFMANIMPYYGLFWTRSPYLDLRWRSRNTGTILELLITSIVRHKNKNRWVGDPLWRSCSLFCVVIFHESETIHMISTGDPPLTCSCYNILWAIYHQIMLKINITGKGRGREWCWKGIQRVDECIMIRALTCDKTSLICMQFKVNLVNTSSYVL